MPYRFNPFTSNFDYYSSGGAQSANYVLTFNNSTDWGVASGGYYTITILQGTHNKGTDPVIQVFELNGTDYDVVDTTVFIDSITNAISIKALETPDSRFQGKIVISENN